MGIVLAVFLRSISSCRKVHVSCGTAAGAAHPAGAKANSVSNMLLESMVVFKSFPLGVEE